MKLYDLKLHLVLPIFAGALGSLLVCIHLAFSGLFYIDSAVLQGFVRQEIAAEDVALDAVPVENVINIDIPAVQVVSVLPAAAVSGEAVPIAASMPPLTDVSSRNLDRLLVSRPVISCDFILESYRDIEYREWVLSFFAAIAGNAEIAAVILENTDRFDVPPALAFALAWEESRFNPRALNRANRNGSVDRGLFQLNNRSFPQLELNAFFNIETNAYHGIMYLRQSLDAAGHEVGALAMYNAGGWRVRHDGTPKVTLGYVQRILANRNKIEEAFREFISEEKEARSTAAMMLVMAEEEEIDEPASPMRFSFERTFILALAR